MSANRLKLDKPLLVVDGLRAWYGAAQALFDVKRYKEAARIAKERLDGIMNEKNELIRMVKSLQRKLAQAGLK